MTELLRAPRVRLSWPATTLNIYFKAYRVYSRVARTPNLPWKFRAELGVPVGYTRGTVEALHTAFDDYMMGWSVTGGEFETGHDYVVTVVDVTDSETRISPALVTARRVTVPVANTPWITNNLRPYLNCPVDILQGATDSVDPRVVAYNYAGRDRFVTIAPEERPGRVVTAGAQFFSAIGPDQIRPLRGVSNSGLEVALLKRLGDRVVGTVHVTGFAPIKTARQSVAFTMYESDDSVVANFNHGAGVVLDGSNDYVRVTSATQLNPSSSAFSVVMAAKFNATASRYALAKGNLGTADGYGLRTTGVANELQFFVDGATTSGGPSATSTAWFDDVRVAVGTTSGTNQVLYRDGVEVATSAVTHGSVTNAVNLSVGANNAGASAFSALAPFRSLAIYNRELTATEAQAASYYLLGYPGYRMPNGAVLFIDLRDDRAWTGTQTTIADLSDYANSITLVNGPLTRGIPWPIAQTEIV